MRRQTKEKAAGTGQASSITGGTVVVVKLLIVVNVRFFFLRRGR